MIIYNFICVLDKLFDGTYNIKALEGIKIYQKNNMSSNQSPKSSGDRGRGRGRGHK